MIPDCPICGAQEYDNCKNTKTGKTRCTHGARIKAIGRVMDSRTFHLNQEIVKIQEKYIPKIQNLAGEMETKISNAKLRYGWGQK